MTNSAIGADIAVIPVVTTHQTVRMPDGSTLVVKMEPRDRWGVFGQLTEGIPELLALFDLKTDAHAMADTTRRMLATFRSSTGPERMQ